MAIVSCTWQEASKISVELVRIGVPFTFRAPVGICEGYAHVVEVDDGRAELLAVVKRIVQERAAREAADCALISSVQGRVTS